MNATLSLSAIFNLTQTLFLLAMEIGPQPHSVVRSVIFSAMQEGVQLMMDWICQFNSGGFSTTNPCRNLFAVCVFMACMHLFAQGRCLKEDGLMCTQW